MVVRAPGIRHERNASRHLSAPVRSEGAGSPAVRALQVRPLSLTTISRRSPRLASPVRCLLSAASRSSPTVSTSSHPTRPTYLSITCGACSTRVCTDGSTIRVHVGVEPSANHPDPRAAVLTTALRGRAPYVVELRGNDPRRHPAGRQPRQDRAKAARVRPRAIRARRSEHGRLHRT